MTLVWGGARIEAVSRVSVDQFARRLNDHYLPPPPSQVVASSARSAATRSFANVRPAESGGLDLYVRHNVPRLQQGRAAILFHGCLVDGERPRLSGRLSINVAAAGGLVVGAVFVTVGLLIAAAGVVSLLKGGPHDLGLAAFLACWVSFAWFFGLYWSRTLANETNRFLDGLQGSLGGGHVTITRKPNPVTARRTERH